jgi:hypothetical protein
MKFIGPDLAVVLSYIVAVTSRIRRRTALAMSPSTCRDQETL